MFYCSCLPFDKQTHDESLSDLSVNPRDKTITRQIPENNRPVSFSSFYYICIKYSAARTAVTVERRVLHCRKSFRFDNVDRIIKKKKTKWQFRSCIIPSVGIFDDYRWINKRHVHYGFKLPFIVQCTPSYLCTIDVYCDAILTFKLATIFIDLTDRADTTCDNVSECVSVLLV